MPSWREGNTGINWQPTLKRKNGSVIDISGKSLKLQVQHQVSGAQLEVSGSVVNGPAGLASFPIETVIATAGPYKAEVEISSGGYKEDSFPFEWQVDPPVKA
jgi:hypothetical protein